MPFSVKGDDSMDKAGWEKLRSAATELLEAAREVGTTYAHVNVRPGEDYASVTVKGWHEDYPCTYTFSGGEEWSDAR